MRIVVSAGLMIGLAACATPPASPMASTAPAPMATTTATTAPAMAGGLDGRYRAPAGGASGNSQCGTTKFGYPIVVSNGVASMQTVTAGRLEGKVGADGTLRIEEGRSMLQGQFSGNTFTGTYTRSSCVFNLNYTK